MRRFVPWIVAAALLSGGATTTDAEQRLAFVGVALDSETQQADQKLQDYLYRTAEVSFAPENLEYGRVIDRLASWNTEDGYFVARTTPYVHVAAEMLGAEFETLATYVSATTGTTTYRSYFVVSRRNFESQPDLMDVIRFIRTSPETVRFVYHSKFSTSSFFLPSLVFRANKIFHMPESTGSLTAISSRRIEENSSSRLVEMVAEGQADLAAVWDGTKGRFEAGESGDRPRKHGSQVYFVPLPTAIPNDLLVCSAGLEPAIKERLQSSLKAISASEIATGDFRSWQSIREASRARLALAELRWLARERVAPATVNIRGASQTTPGPLLEAARQAVRLSGTEMVLYDEDFHEHIDYVWTLEKVHDGAVELLSALPGSDIEDQEFRISYSDQDDLTQRIVDLMHSRAHRIRYAWPYSDGDPIVIRDLAFSIPPGSVLKAQRISWLDPERNQFRAGPVFDAGIRMSGFFTYVLNRNDFPQPVELDAMSNVAYRIHLLRPADEPTIFRVLTLLLVVLFGAAALLAGYRLFRPERARTLVTPEP